MKPKSGKRVLILTKDGKVFEGHFIKNANFKEKNVNRWRIYKTGKTIPDTEVVGWAYMEALKKAIVKYEAVRDIIDFHFNTGEEDRG